MCAGWHASLTVVTALRVRWATLRGSPLGVRVAPTPHSDAADKALDGFPVECGHDGWWNAYPLEYALEEEALLSFFCHDAVLVVQQNFSLMGTPRNSVLFTLSTASPLRQGLDVVSPEVDKNLLSLAHIQQVVVVLGQKIDLIPVVSLIALVDETNWKRSRVLGWI